MLKFFNTLTRKKEEFKPIKKGQVGIYTCGPTVYNYAHIGNFRTYMFEDILRRYFEYKGFKIKQVMNITDVDDKTIKNSQKEGVPLMEFTERYTKAFFEDLKTLNIEPAEHYPKATDHIKDMVKIIKVLLKKGIAYKAEDNSIYYSVNKFKNYGKLSKIKIDKLKAGARVCQDEYEKETASDFALWKAWDEADGDIFWETELGKGRPGWHIECSAMSTKYLGKHFDMHTGGVDNMFPHHENEIAQTEAATGEKFVNYWLHSEHLLVDGKKMSKSLGNFYTLRDLLDKGHDPKAIRYLLLATHYKQQLNFTFEGLKASKAAVERLNDFVRSLDVGELKHNQKVDGLIKDATLGFEKAMDDDLNVSEALAAVFNFVKAINRLGELSAADVTAVVDQMSRFDSVLGVLEEQGAILEEEIQHMIEDREHARLNKDFGKADKIRDKLRDKGIILEDTPKGVRWKKE
jgi:cysteinyl-tRNA synthetase